MQLVCSNRKFQQINAPTQAHLLANKALLATSTACSAEDLSLGETAEKNNVNPQKATKPKLHASRDTGSERDPNANRQDSGQVACPPACPDLRRTCDQATRGQKTR